MNNEQCKEVLKTALFRLIQADYVFLDLPYFGNVGDILIWQTTLDLLKSIPYKCLYSASSETYVKPKIDKNAIILFVGGGNFGDLWIRHQIFRYQVMNDFPDNQIVQLPQSVFFYTSESLNKDVEIFSKHRGKVTICLRDQHSFDLIKTNYHGVTALLLPDMVFAFDVDLYLKKYGLYDINGKGSLYVRRNDSESFMREQSDKYVPSDAVVADWPSMGTYYKPLVVYSRFIRVIGFLGQGMVRRASDYLFQRVVKDIILCSGLRFIAKYNRIYTTRLHCGILAYLMGKKVELFDNSYRKISGVYDLWLYDQQNIELR